MKELALHMLDLARNSLNAGATCIEMTVNEQEKENLLIMEVNDNGAYGKPHGNAHQPDPESSGNRLDIPLPAEW